MQSFKTKVHCFYSWFLMVICILKNTFYYAIYLYIFLNICNTSSGLDDDYTNFKKCNSTQTKRNESDDLIHAIIGLAIVAVLIIVIYLYTYLLGKILNRRRYGLVFRYDSIKRVLVYAYVVLVNEFVSACFVSPYWVVVMQILHSSSDWFFYNDLLFMKKVLHFRSTVFSKLPLYLCKFSKLAE